MSLYHHAFELSILILSQWKNRSYRTHALVMLIFYPPLIHHIFTNEHYYTFSDCESQE